MNSVQLSVRKRVLLGLSLMAFSLVAQVVGAYCAGGYVAGDVPVYKCIGACAIQPQARRRYSKGPCAVVCCPDGDVEVNYDSCDTTEWAPDYGFGWMPICCPSSYGQGYEYVLQVGCDPSDG
jgi:hypothetical protein